MSNSSSEQARETGLTADAFAAMGTPNLAYIALVVTEEMQKLLQEQGGSNQPPIACGTGVLRNPVGAGPGRGVGASSAEAHSAEAITAKTPCAATKNECKACGWSVTRRPNDARKIVELGACRISAKPQGDALVPADLAPYIDHTLLKGDTTRASVDEVIKELMEVRGSRPLTEKEIDQARSGLRKSFPGKFEQMSQVASLLQDLALSGYSPDWYRNWPEKIQAVDRDTAHATCMVYTDPATFGVVVAGDWEKIGESIQGLNRRIIHYDAQGHRKTEVKKDADAKD